MALLKDPYLAPTEADPFDLWPRAQDAPTQEPTIQELAEQEGATMFTSKWPDWRNPVEAALEKEVPPPEAIAASAAMAAMTFAFLAGVTAPLTVIAIGVAAAVLVLGALNAEALREAAGAFSEVLTLIRKVIYGAPRAMADTTGIAIELLFPLWLIFLAVSFGWAASRVFRLFR